MNRFANVDGVPEEFKVIPGFDGKYIVSSYGRVESLQGITSRFLKPNIGKIGYANVRLCVDGICKTLSLHRLVAEAFLDNSENERCINHIDEDKTNNFKSNLEWCSYKYNNNHGTHNARSAASRSIAVYQYTKDKGIMIKEWPSMSEAGRNGFSLGNISSVCSGRIPHHKGFFWSKTKV